MLTYEQAISRILEKVTPGPKHGASLLGALNAVAAETILSGLDLPPFANSAMDGFAVRGSDLASVPVTLPVTGEVAAGAHAPHYSAPGAAQRIMTGAPLPEGADTVVPVENAHVDGQFVEFDRPVTAGQFVRHVGEDVVKGDPVLSAGSLIHAQHIGLLAAVGRQTVQIYSAPKVAILSTGDELTEPGQTLAPGQIYNSNSYALAAQVAQAGGTVVRRILARDTPDDIQAALDTCADADIILSSGGVSVGEYDFVKDVVSAGGTLDFWRVAIRPGKPLAFGHYGNALFFGLPGNPVSAMVTFELFVRPALLKMRGLSELHRQMVQAELDEPANHEPSRRSFQRAHVRREGDIWRVRPLKQQGSHQMRGMAESNALLILPEDIPLIPAGDRANVLLLT